MKSLKQALFYGFLVWVIPFVVAIFIFPLRADERPLFESIMPVVVTLSTVLFSVLYLKKVETHFFREGVLLGLIWLAIGIAIDLFMFMQGPMKMPFMDYVKDIAITYLIIPTITTGCGYLIERKNENK